MASDIKRLMDQLSEMTIQADQTCYRCDRDRHFNDALQESYDLLGELWPKYKENSND